MCKNGVERVEWEKGRQHHREWKGCSMMVVGTVNMACLTVDSSTTTLSASVDYGQYCTV